MENKKICMVGLGYIGLPTAVILANHNIDVLGYDINSSVTKSINNKDTSFAEPGLDKLITKCVNSGKFLASNEIESSDVFIIAVPTPFLRKKNKHDNPEPDLSFIKNAIKEVGGVLKKGDLIILESTSPVGTTSMISETLSNLRKDLTFPHNNQKPDVNIAYCPERVLPGKVLVELITNDRLIGGITPQCSKKAKKIYEIFVKGQCIITNSKTAEMSKLTENAFRDLNIAFANELSIICDELNINVWDLIKLSNLHPRVNILNPGPGVGGHCIAVDPWFIVHEAQESSKLIRQARNVNDNKKLFSINKILGEIETFTTLKNKQPIVAIFGLAFKPNIEDLRESPSLEIAHEIQKSDLEKLLIVEPNIEELPSSLSFKNVEHLSVEQALNKADMIIILVAHKEFQNLTIGKDQSVMDFVGITE